METYFKKVSVKDKTPELPRKFYVAYLENSDTPFLFEWRGHWNHDGIEIKHVTHWLEELPKLSKTARETLGEELWSTLNNVNPSLAYEVISAMEDYTLQLPKQPDKKIPSKTAEEVLREVAAPEEVLLDSYSQETIISAIKKYASQLPAESADTEEFDSEIEIGELFIRSADEDGDFFIKIGKNRSTSLGTEEMKDIVRFINYHLSQSEESYTGKQKEVSLPSDEDVFKNCPYNKWDSNFSVWLAGVNWLKSQVKFKEGDAMEFEFNEWISYNKFQCDSETRWWETKYIHSLKDKKYTGRELYEIFLSQNKK